MIDARKPYTLAAHYEAFREIMLPDAPDDGRDDLLRTAFYSGATVATEMLTTAAEQEDPTIFHGLRGEITAFLVAIQVRSAILHQTKEPETTPQMSHPETIPFPTPPEDLP